jgi:hypothetical protein
LVVVRPKFPSLRFPSVLVALLMLCTAWSPPFVFAGEPPPTDCEAHCASVAAELPQPPPLVVSNHSCAHCKARDHGAPSIHTGHAASASGVDALHPYLDPMTFALGAACEKACAIREGSPRSGDERPVSPVPPSQPSPRALLSGAIDSPSLPFSICRAPLRLGHARAGAAFQVDPPPEA